MDFEGIGCGGGDWINIDQDREKWRAFVNILVSLGVPYTAKNLSSDFTIGDLPNRAHFHKIIYLFATKQDLSPRKWFINYMGP
jgi:hypothetical protein